MNLTNRAKNHFLALGQKIANIFMTHKTDEETIKDFCRAEYKGDWYAAYMTFKQEGVFPKFHRRTL